MRRGNEHGSLVRAGAGQPDGRAHRLQRGFVLPFALAQGVTATATARADGLLVLRSKQKPDDPVTVALDALAPGSVTGWAAYPAGVAWALGAAGFDIAGASIDIDSDLPVGAGVSSSAALECSVALALCSLSGLTVARGSSR